MKAIFEAQRSGAWTLCKDGTVEIGGVVLQSGQYDMRIKMPEGVTAAPFDRGQGVVVLDTTVTDELRAEGWARDVVRLIQNARKQSNFNLVDRINVAIEAHGQLKAALQCHRRTIMEETLAQKLSLDAELPKDSDDVAFEELDGEPLRFTIARI
jgi:isoleucyl-tRNA synthetase